MDDIEGLTIEHQVYVCGSDILCIFLPSGREQNAISTYPRLGWRKKLPGLDLLYLADPFQHVEEFKTIGGSWFIDLKGESVLPSLGEVLRKHVERSGYRKTILYGSSMGGYAAIILGSMINNAHAIAECPQLYLERYPTSNHVISTFCSEEQRERLPNPVSALLEDTNSSSFTIVANAFDQHHISEHVLPLMNLLLTKVDSFKSRIQFHFYINDNYPRNHSALWLDDAIHLIQQAQGAEAVSEAALLRSQINQLEAQVASLSAQNKALGVRLEEIEASKFTKLARLYYRLAQSWPFRTFYRPSLQRKKRNSDHKPRSSQQ